MRFVIFTGGILRSGNAVSQALLKADRIIAADSGAETALNFNAVPDTVLGDLDSLKAETAQKLKKQNCKFIISPEEKNETDTELAIQYAIDNKAEEIFLLGGMEGDRIDHILANIFFTSSLKIPIRFVNGSTTAWVEKGPKNAEIKGNIGDLLSLIPLTTEVKSIKTNNLQYRLKSESLFFAKSRGVSNVFLEKNAEINFSEGLLFFVHTGKNELIEKKGSPTK